MNDEKIRQGFINEFESYDVGVEGQALAHFAKSVCAREMLSAFQGVCNEDGFEALCVRANPAIATVMYPAEMLIIAHILIQRSGPDHKYESTLNLADFNHTVEEFEVLWGWIETALSATSLTASDHTPMAYITYTLLGDAEFDIPFSTRLDIVLGGIHLLKHMLADWVGDQEQYLIALASDSNQN